MIAAFPVLYDFVVVSNRLPIERVENNDGVMEWRTSPGGLVTAMEPVVEQLGCAWVGWPGDGDGDEQRGEPLEPFASDGIFVHPLVLSSDEITEYYEGFSNTTVWPLYHDVIAPPEYHREWWDAYRRVNQRFADAAAEIAAPGATVWVHDYQLQLVPGLLRALRPDLVIGFFLHIPFPGGSIYGQLPWRKQILEGVLGADVIGFQRVADAAQFRAAARRYLGAPSNGNSMMVAETATSPARWVLAQEFPISIDAEAFSHLSERADVARRAEEIREGLGNPKRIILGVDRLDYTKGIHHRLKAFGELLDEGTLDAEDVSMVIVASPSRERVDAYRQLRDEIELMVGRINGDHGTLDHAPVVYLHQGYPREEMAALYRAADVLMVTALRDGMNLVAKEYIACRGDGLGVLILSEFTGAADELRRALLINPHDIDGMKAALVAALSLSETEQRKRMRALRRVVFRASVAQWAEKFLGALEQARARRITNEEETMPMGDTQQLWSSALDTALQRFSASSEIIIACDFDGTLAPIVPRPEDARILPESAAALDVLQELPGVTVGLISGRSVAGLEATGIRTDGRIVAGSHGAEMKGIEPDLSSVEQAQLARVHERVRDLLAPVEGADWEDKPYGVTIHTRRMADRDQVAEVLEAIAQIAEELSGPGQPVTLREGKEVRELSVRRATKGEIIAWMHEHHPEAAVLYIGDDVTDEEAFMALRDDDLDVWVGRAADRHRTVARYRVDSPEQVAILLQRLVQLRADASS